MKIKPFGGARNPTKNNTENKKTKTFLFSDLRICIYKNHKKVAMHGGVHSGDPEHSKKVRMYENQ